MPVKECIKHGAKLYCFNKDDKTVSLFSEQKIDLKECPEDVINAIIDVAYDVKMIINATPIKKRNTEGIMLARNCAEYNGVMKKLKYFFVYWVWQFPQMLLGAILVKILKAEKRTITTKDGLQIDHWYFKRETKFSRFISGVSLAIFILLSDNNNDEDTICHEYGHSRQSLYLGLFYLLIIGIPSVCGNLWSRYAHKDWSDYDRHCWYYIILKWEKWADKLGNVDRIAVLNRILVRQRLV